MAEETKLREPELVSRKQELAANRARFEALVAGLTADQLAYRPAPDSWSIAACAAHLAATARAYRANADAAIRDGRERGVTGTGPFRYGWFMNWAIRSLDPDRKKTKMKAPGLFDPGPVDDPASALDDFRAELDRMEDRFHAADGLHLAKIRLATPVTKLIRMTLGQYFRLFTVHDRRHIAQMERVKSSEGFPAS